LSGGRVLLVAGVGDGVFFGADGKPVDDGLLGVLEEDLHVGVVGVPGEGVKEGSLPGAVLVVHDVASVDPGTFLVPPAVADPHVGEQMGLGQQLAHGFQGEDRAKIILMALIPNNRGSFEPAHVHEPMLDLLDHKAEQLEEVASFLKAGLEVVRRRPSFPAQGSSSVENILLVLKVVTNHLDDRPEILEVGCSIPEPGGDGQTTLVVGVDDTGSWLKTRRRR